MRVDSAWKRLSCHQRLVKIHFKRLVVITKYNIYNIIIETKVK